MTIRPTLRSLARQRGFAAAVTLITALGVGANTALFTVVDAVVLRPLDFAEPERLVMVWHRQTRDGAEHEALSHPTFRDLREHAATIADAAAVSPILNLQLQAELGPERIPGVWVSPHLFDLLGVRPALGRAFERREPSSDHEMHAGELAAVVSHRFWRSRLGGDPEALGRPLDFGMGFRVIGVMPAGFRFLDDVDVWLPLELGPVPDGTRERRQLRVVARLAADARLDEAAAELDTLAAQLAQDHPENAGLALVARPLHDEVVGGVRPALVALLGGVGFVLLLACVNLATLLLNRASARRRELALRAALGAPRRRLVGELLAESLLVVLPGGVIGFFLAQLAVGLLPAYAPPDLPRLAEVAIDGRVLLFCLAVTMASGVLAGLVPALRASGFDLVSAVKETGGGEGRSGRCWRDAFGVAEVALALVLLIAAGLMIRSFTRLMATRLGFDPEHLLTLQLSSEIGDHHERMLFFRQLLERVEALPSVVAAGAGRDLPLGEGSARPLAVEGRPAAPGERPQVEVRRASPGYFKALRIPLVAGRVFTPDDDLDAPPVALVNETAARRLWTDAEALGGRFRLDDPEAPPWTIVGVVGDVRAFGPAAEPRPEVYLPFDQAPPFGPRLAVRFTGEAAPLIPALRALLRELDPEMGVFGVETMDAIVADSVARRRFGMVLTGVFGLLALVLAATGVYGVVAYRVTRRTREMAIRLAVGATPGQVFAGVVRHGAALAAAGLVLGLAGAWAATRLLSGFLYGIAPTDPATWLAVSLALASVVVLASAVPANRATHVDSAETLRAE